MQNLYCARTQSLTKLNRILYRKWQRRGDRRQCECVKHQSSVGEDSPYATCEGIYERTDAQDLTCASVATKPFNNEARGTRSKCWMFYLAQCILCKVYNRKRKEKGK
ncbi:MAG: hypothetical protein PHT72_03060 [Candidatus Absconditabacteria bacterium]|nr:hypothetical protein [Candidatus Absconditabacteria bacterium]